MAMAGALCTAPLQAQRVMASVDVSGTGVWYADSVHAAGSSLSPAMRIDWANGTLGASGELSRVGGGLSAQGMLAPSIFTPSAGPFSAELAASLGGSTHPDGTRTGETLAFARVYAGRTGAGGWVGGGLGRTWDGVEWRGVRQAEAGAWLEHDRLTSLAMVTPVVVADTIRYTDVQVALRYPTGPFELGFTAGARAGAVGRAVGGTSRAWGSLGAVAWMSSNLALVGSAGTYPVDLTQGYPGGRFVAIALRIASRNSRLSRRLPTTRERLAESGSDPVQRPPVTRFDVRTGAGNSRTIRIDAPAARVVEVSGDFTQWQPIALTRAADGAWSVTLPIVSGTHQMNVRLDRGSWLVPPGLLATTDEFGGAVGILSIE